MRSAKTLRFIEFLRERLSTPGQAPQQAVNASG
jgi:hypothetical protein